MKTIKEQMYELIERMKIEFKRETGIEMIAFPNIGPDTKLLSELQEDVEIYTGQQIINKSRKEEVVEAKRIFAVTALKMGISYSDISKYLQSDRSNVYNHEDRHEQLLNTDLGYKRKYNTFISKFHEKERRTGTE